MTMRFRFCWLAWAVLMIATAKVPGASGTEAQSLKVAVDTFKDGAFYDRAERFCAEFIQKFPASPHLPEVVLLQARSRLEQSNYAGAIELLVANQNVVGVNKDEFVFWMGEGRLRAGDYKEAGNLFARVVNDFGSSPRRLEAAVKQGVVGAKLGEWQKVIDLLGAKENLFQKEASTNSAGDIVLQGYLLLAEAHLNRSNHAAAEAVLDPLGKRVLSATNAWAWNYLLCRAQLQAGKIQAALDTTTNLLSLASQTGVAALQGQSAAFRGEILESMGRLDEALAAYTNNLAARIPLERQRQAIQKTARLLVAQNKSEEAAQLLEKFLTQNPQAAAADVAWVQLGELRLRQFVEWLGSTNAAGTNAAATNQLQQAIGAFQRTTKQFSQSALLGAAFMDLGWCFWFQDKMKESQDAFQRSLEHLPAGSARTQAQFKLGDTQFRAKEYAAAMTNYEAALKEPSSPAKTSTELVEPALYQIVRTGLAAGNLSAASNAMSRILAEYPKDFYTERAVLLFGQRIGSEGSPGRAREVFQDFLNKAPETILKPEVQLAIARTYEEENGWLKAIETYGEWLRLFTNHAARPEAVFYRAQAMFHAGDETNAHNCFTNFVAEYPKHTLAAEARWWIADHYYSAGAYRAAEEKFQIIEHTWPRTELGYEALMMAGRAAFMRQGWNDAIDYFYNKLAGDTNCPVDLHFRALCAYGDTLMSQVSTNKGDDYAKALGAYETICQQYSTNHLAVLACGEKAICLLQLARSDAQLTNAVDAFKAVLTNTVYADGTAISIAKVGLGTVLEKQATSTTGAEQSALKNEALDQYMDVLDGLYLKENEGDEFWTREAGKQAIRLASEMQEWLKVVRICERMVEKLPQTAPSFEEPKRKAMDNLARGKIASEK